MGPGPLCRPASMFHSGIITSQGCWTYYNKLTFCASISIMNVLYSVWDAGTFTDRSSTYRAFQWPNLWEMKDLHKQKYILFGSLWMWYTVREKKTFSQTHWHDSAIAWMFVPKHKPDELFWRVDSRGVNVDSEGWQFVRQAVGELTSHLHAHIYIWWEPPSHESHTLNLPSSPASKLNHFSTDEIGGFLSKCHFEWRLA